MLQELPHWPFILASSRGKGAIPYLPPELRREIHKWLTRSTPCEFRCRFCPRVLCVTMARASSYTRLAQMERICLDCFCEALT